MDTMAKGTTRILVWLLLVAAAAMLVGCSKDEDAGVQGEQDKAGRPVVCVSNYPLKYFAARIAGPLVEVRFPVPRGEDPAFWKPTHEDIQAMQQADLVVLNGASYESWLKNVSLRPSRMIDTSAGFKKRHDPLKGGPTHSHGREGVHEHTGTAFTTWLDLTLAVEQARAIKDAFSKRWPQRKGQFDAQFGELTKDLEALDAEIKEIMKGAQGIPVVFSHPVYQYFKRRYKLDGKAVHWEPDEMPSDAMWQELTTLLRSHPAKWMIWEGEPSSDIKAKLAKRGIRSVVFDPCGGAPEDGDFASVMKQNLAALKTMAASKTKPVE